MLNRGAFKNLSLIPFWGEKLDFRFCLNERTLLSHHLINEKLFVSLLFLYLENESSFLALESLVYWFSISSRGLY